MQTLTKKTSKGEILLREYLSLKYHWVKHEYNVRPDWLKWKTGNNLELDVFIPDLNLAFEFNGSHHLTSLIQKRRDLCKREMCEKKGVMLYTFSLQTLHYYAVTHGHTDGKYSDWFLKLTQVLEDYRSRFKDDKTVAPIWLPTPPEPKNSGRGFVRGMKQRKLPKKLQWTKRELKRRKEQALKYADVQEKESQSNKLRAIYKMFNS